MHTFFKFSKYHKKMVVIFIAAVFVIGCPQLFPPETVEFVDLERYAGLWYEIARYDTPCDEDTVAVTHEYTLNDDGTVSIVKSGLVGDLEGPCTSIEGIARVVDTETNAKLSVSFTRPKIPFKRFEYWIIELGEYYSYAVISNSMRSSLYIISRTPTIDESTYQNIIDGLTVRGFDPDRIVLTPQIDEMPPPQTVDFVDIERYAGVWYQIASYIIPNIEDLAGVTAEYSLNEDGTVKVVNKGLVGGLDGDPVSIEGVARVVDEKTNAKLAVSFPEFGISEESEYWIIELGEYYSHAVVTNSQRSSLFILSRTPTIEESTYLDLIYSLTARGFDPEKIVLTPQIDEMLPPETVDFVDIERYVGLWYEIARYDTPFDEDAVEVTAEYTLNEDDTVGILNSGVRPDGTPTSIEGVARVDDFETNAKLLVSFDRPELEGIEFNYWIIELDEDYQYAVVTDDIRFTLYVLSRTPTMEDAVYEDILYRVVKKGFDANTLELTLQPEA